MSSLPWLQGSCCGSVQYNSVSPLGRQGSHASLWAAFLFPGLLAQIPQSLDYPDIRIQFSAVRTFGGTTTDTVHNWRTGPRHSEARVRAVGAPLRDWSVSVTILRVILSLSLPREPSLEAACHLPNTVHGEPNRTHCIVFISSHQS